jgi:hypothetical protein
MVKLYMISQGKLENIAKPIFTTGDAYLVVDETAQKIYIWLGSKCSVDEKGTAAVEARRIDDAEFKGNAKILTYDQGDEPADFLAKLDGLKVIEKNLAKTMLKDVKTGEWAGQSDHVNALYRVSSEEYAGNMAAIKYVQVPFEKASLDSEDVFIADLGVDIWIWVGKNSNAKEKAKALDFAKKFDAERAGAQRPVIFDEGEDDAKFLGIFEGKLPASDVQVVDLKAEVFDQPPIEPALKEKPVEVPKPVKAAAPLKPIQIPASKETHAPSPKPAAEPITAPPKAPPAKEAPKSEKEVAVLIQTSSGRLQCPKCGNNAHNMIREFEDRSHIIMDYPIIFGKKFHCGKCGTWWRREGE